MPCSRAAIGASAQVSVSDCIHIAVPVKFNVTFEMTQRMTNPEPARATKAWISNVALLSAAALFLLSRIVYLDQDAPAWYFTFYAPTDEPYYTIPAFNLLRYGTWTHKVFDFLPLDEGPLTAVQSLLTYVGLLLFGNNFFGLRMSAVACGFFIFIGTLWCLHKTPGLDPAWKKLVAGLAAAYMLGDFFFLQSNRINDPTTFMMAGIVACMMAVMAIDARMPRSLLGSFLLGLLAGFAATFVYVYLIYVAAALGAAALFGCWRNDRGRIFLHALAFAAGGIISVLIFAAFVLVCFQMDPIELVSRLLATGGIRGDFIRSNMFGFIGQHAVDAVLQNVTHNLFVYNPALLFIFLAALPVFVLRLVREPHTIDFFVAACLVFRLLLSALIPFDYYEKKLIQVFPLVIYVIAISAVAAKPLYRNSFAARAGWLAAYIAFLILLAILVDRLTQTRDPAAHVHPELIAHIEMWIALPLVALVLILSGSLKKTAACVLVAVVLLPGVRLDRKYVFAAPTFQYRDSLIRAAPRLNGKILAGGVAYAMRLYNTSIPTMNFYAYYYYGYDKFAAYSRYLYDHKLADGTILFVPFHEATILKPIYDYVNAGGLVLDEAFDIRDVEEKYRFAIYLVPRAGQPAKSPAAGRD